MAGTIRCARHGCGRVRHERVCPECGNPSVYISLYWKAPGERRGRRYRFGRDRHGNVLVDYKMADAMLGAMLDQINNPNTTFNPLDFAPQAFAERRLEHQAELWLLQKQREAEGHELAWRTLGNYRGYVRNHFVPLLGAHDVRDIGYAQLEGFKDRLPRTLKLKTRRNILNALHDLFTHMHRVTGAVREFPPWPTIEGDDSSTRVPLDYETQQAELAKLPEPFRGAIAFMFEAGLRAGELCALQVRDFDEVNRAVIVRRTWDGPRLVERTKGMNKIWVGISDPAWRIAAPLLRGRGPEEFVFRNPQATTPGRPFRPKVLLAAWRRYTGRSDDLHAAGRHSFCSHLSQDGVDLGTAQELMRHNTKQSTLRYTHAASPRHREAVNRRGRVVKFPEKDRAEGEE